MTCSSTVLFVRTSGNETGKSSTFKLRPVGTPRFFLLKLNRTSYSRQSVTGFQDQGSLNSYLSTCSVTCWFLVGCSVNWLSKLTRREVSLHLIFADISLRNHPSWAFLQLYQRHLTASFKEARESIRSST